MTTAVSKKTSTEVSTDVLDDIYETAGDGAHYDSSEMQIPFIRVLQALSPQLNKKKPEYIEGATSGDIYNTVTNQVWPSEKGITVIPVYQETKYLEFVPRSQGGGFKGERHASDPDLQSKLRERGMEPAYLDSEKTSELMKRDVARWREVANKLKLVLE